MPNYETVVALNMLSIHCSILGYDIVYICIYLTMIRRGKLSLSLRVILSWEFMERRTVVSMPSKIPEERRSHLCRRGSLIFFHYFEDEDLVSQKHRKLYTRLDGNKSLKKEVRTSDLAISSNVTFMGFRG